MSRVRSLPGVVLTAVGLLWLTVTVPACDEDGKTAPEKCLEPPLGPPYDIQAAHPITGTETGGAPDTTNPCVTKVGHAISDKGTPGDGTASGGTTGGTGKGGGSGDSAMNDAGAGGA